MLKFICLYKKGLFLYGVLLFCTLSVFSQFTIRFRLIALPGNHIGDSIYAAGNFNKWSPAKTGNVFSQKNEPVLIELKDLPSGNYQFKFTRGNYQTVECKSDGKDIANRSINLSADTTILVTVEAWKDDFAPLEKLHTASPNVIIVDTAFPMPQLGRTRRIWLYLPPGYAKSKKRYPVMYLQDGQNVFDNYTSGYGEWGADETADSMVKMGKPPCIMVGIDNGPKRINEYNPYEFKDFGKGEGDLYLNFIVDNLKPFIDKKYRTLSTSDNTIIAGSSMGGLIAYYAMLKYPKVFGKGGIFSPAFWTAEAIKALTDAAGKNLTGSLFFYIGGQEGDQAILDMNDITEKLGKNSTAIIYTVVDPEGKHNEAAWFKWFPEFYNWVLANGFNNVINLDAN